MDLLGSILSSMDKPPTMSDKKKALLKKQREELERRQQVEAENLKIFREKVEENINNFLKDDSAKECAFPPMDKVYRSIIRDVSEVANILAYSFGEEGIDRHIIIFKKEHAPTEDHLNALRRGEEWNDDVAEELKREYNKKLLEKEKEDFENENLKKNFIPNSDYKDKYEHIIGKEAALEAARKTEANSNYGCVPCENKKDIRSIEQTLADIRKKRRKLE